MKDIEKARNQLIEFIGKRSPAGLLFATITAVHDDDTVSIEFPEGGKTDECRLRSVVSDGNRVLLIPKVNTPVIVGRIDRDDEFVVLMVSEITEVRQVIDTTTFSQTADGFVMKKGNDDLLNVIQLIIEAVVQIVVIQGKNPDYIKLNQALEKAQNLLKHGT